MARKEGLVFWYRAWLAVLPIYWQESSRGFRLEGRKRIARAFVLRRDPSSAACASVPAAKASGSHDAESNRDQPESKLSDLMWPPPKLVGWSHSVEGGRYWCPPMLGLAVPVTSRGLGVAGGIWCGHPIDTSVWWNDSIDSRPPTSQLTRGSVESSGGGCVCVCVCVCVK